MHRNTADGRLSRRGVLALGLTIVPVVAGCSSSPAIEGASRVTPSPEPPPPPLPGLDAGLAAESTALAWCDAISAKGYELSAGLTANLPGITEVHRRHLLALQLPDPPARPTGTPSAGLDPQAGSVDLGSDDARKAATRMAAAFGEVAATHRGAAVAAEGAAARFWASLAAAAAQSQRLVPRTHAHPRLAEEKPHAPLEVPEPAAALGELLVQTHALVYGCQVALTGVSGKAAESTVARLDSARRLRDDVTDALRVLDADVPAAAGAYEVEVPTDDGGTRTLVRSMENALLPYVGAAISAVSDQALRTRLVDALIERTRVGIDLGGRPLRWPGLPG
ncbi:DUF4439 domain-containing protein [Propionibacteriaceae bacterium Y1685]